MNEELIYRYIPNKETGDVEIRKILFDKDSNVAPDDGVDTGGFEKLKDSVKLRVYSYVLPKSKIKSYSIYNLVDKNLANIIKHDRTKDGKHITWYKSLKNGTDAKKEFLDYSAEKMKATIEAISLNNKVEPKYIIAP